MSKSRKANADITTVNRRSVGIDVHKDKLVACFAEVCSDRTTKQGQEEQINYQFLTVRGNFEERAELVQWVLERRPDAIIMESTGVYWKAIYLELEEAGLHPELINPRHFHSAEEGRKTDKTDAKWLANLARLGLYRASFVPEEPMRTLRLFVVATKKLVEGRKADKNRLTKILDDSGIHFSRVFSDPVEGKTARGVLNLLVAGRLTIEAVEAIRDDRCYATAEEIMAACNGTLSEPSKLLVQLYTERLAAADKQIERLIGFMNDELEKADLIKSVMFLQTMPGINIDIARTIVSVVGGRDSLLNNFRSAHQFARYVGTCPGDHESAGVRKSSRCPHGLSTIKTVIVEAAQAAARSKGTLLQEIFQKKRYKGYNQAVMVVAHKLTVLIYLLLTRQEPYHDKTYDYEMARAKKSKPRWLKHAFYLLKNKDELLSEQDISKLKAAVCNAGS